MKRHSVIYITTLLIFLFFPFKLANAQTSSKADPFSITLSPSTTYVKLSAGASTQEQLLITNGSDQTTTASIYIRDFVAQDKKGNIKIYFDTDTLAGVQSWIKFGNDQSSSSNPSEYKIITITLTPKQTYSLEYSITVPPKAYLGTHSAIIFIQPDIYINSGSNGASILGRVGANLFIDVLGGANPKIDVTNYSLSQSSFLSTPTIQGVITNPSDYISSATTNIHVTGPFINKNYSLDNTHVLPHSARIITQQGSSPVPINGLLIGEYSIDLTVLNLNTNQEIHKYSTVFYISAKILLAFAFITALVIATLAILYIRHKTHHFHEIKKSSY